MPIANSQWYTTSLTPINSTPTSDKDNPICNSAPVTNIPTPVFELTEEVRKVLTLTFKSVSFSLAFSYIFALLGRNVHYRVTLIYVDLHNNLPMFVHGIRF